MKNKSALIWTTVVVGIGLGIYLWQKPSPPARAVPRPAETVSSVAVPGPRTRVNPAPQVPKAPTPKFMQMSAQERDVALEQIKRQSLGALFSTWVACGHSQPDLRKQAAVGALLAQAMRTNPPDPPLLGTMRAFLGDQAEPLFERTELLRVLGQAKTKEAHDLLVGIETAPQGQPLKEAADREIQSVGALWGDGTFHEELSPALERVWQESQDPNLLGSVAVAMAKVGAPGGVRLLLSSIVSETPGDVRSSLARAVLPEILNRDAVPVLSELLAKSPPTSAVGVAVGETLVSIGNDEAAKALINWLQSADESASPLAYKFVLQTRAPATREYWDAALNASVPFHSEKNRDAIRDGLADYDKTHRFVGR